MIQLKKSYFWPFNEGVKMCADGQSLYANPTHPAIIKKIVDDQNGKCYLCERHLTTDITIDHFRPKISYSNLKFEWRNLFLSCAHCNSIKHNDFDDILNPLQHDIVREIKQIVDFDNFSFCFIPLDKNNHAQVKLANLLDKIHNAKTISNKIRHQNFHEYVMIEMLRFDMLCKSFLVAKSKKCYNDVARQLLCDAEFLGLKYWYIHENPILHKEFHPLLTYGHTVPCLHSTEQHNTITI